MSDSQRFAPENSPEIAKIIVIHQNFRRYRRKAILYPIWFFCEAMKLIILDSQGMRKMAIHLLWAWKNPFLLFFSSSKAHHIRFSRNERIDNLVVMSLWWMHFFSFFCKAMELIILDSQWMRKWQFVMNLKDMKLWSSEAPHIDSQGMRKMALWLSDETTNEARRRAAKIW